ncbi:hypothetical protein EIP91_009910 [Steccherinum ochraceum]|uniref:Mob1/phocein n=1 Tax=Steccherinum ochraceum TaxID=92696 RepID=A0A4R0RZM9_9APHY|nr:hypothetical protein EIP91_009910 [Steccherinum ochraceum]
MVQRPLKGSRISSFYPVKTLPSLASLDSAFQLQEYISLLIRLDVHDVETIVSLPGKPLKERQPSDDDKENLEGVEKEVKNEIVVDEQCWIYEQLRRLAQDLSHPLITMLQQECTRATCSEMKAAEWLYLCVAHGNDGAMEQCCAIDYILHTLDSATALLNSPRAFPSRLTIPEASRRHFPSLARRLGRIFAHAYFHHREAFEQAEAESSLYARFLALTSKFDLVPSEFLVIPPRLSSMHDNEDGNERLLDIGDAEEPRRFNPGLDSQRASERWGSMSDTGSVIDLALADESDVVENHSDGTKKRWRSDTMVDRDTYLMGKFKREGSLEKVFAEGPTQLASEPTPASEPHILDIAAPAPTEPHIPTSDVPEENPKPESSSLSDPPQQEELMKPPIVVPSQARIVPDPEPADPILEEPPITPVPPPIPVPAHEPTPEEHEEEHAAASEEASAAIEAPEEVVPQTVAEEQEEHEEANSSEDITSSRTELETVSAVKSEETVSKLLDMVHDEPALRVEEDSVKEEDVTEATVEDVVDDASVPEAEAPAPTAEEVPSAPAAEETEDKPALEEAAEDIIPAQPVETPQAATTEP